MSLHSLSLHSFFPYTLSSPILPLPLEVGPYIAARGSGERLSFPVGSGAEPRPQKQFWHIWSPVKASGGKDLGSSCYMLFLLRRPSGLKVGQWPGMAQWTRRHWLSGLWPANFRWSASDLQLMGYHFIWVNRPLYVSQLCQFSLSSSRGR